MLELSWALLNLILLILFIVICFKAAIAVRKELGFWSFLFLAVCLFSFAVDKDDTNESKIFDLSTKAAPLLNKFTKEQRLIIKDQVIDDNILTDINLWAKFVKDKNETMMLSARTFRSGIIMGTRWKSELVTILDTNKEGFYKYEVIGTTEWTLMGFRIYSEPKIFEGSINLNERVNLY